MNETHRELIKHSAIYGVGQVLAASTSVIMLPIYTRYLTPADYGIMAIVQLTISVLSIVLGTGTVRAVNRHHFEMPNERERDRLWWTGVTFLAIASAALVAPMLLARGLLADLTLGPIEGASGGRLYSLALLTLCFTALGQLLQAHLRVYKRSGLLVGTSLAQLMLAVALNLLFLIALGRGVEGVMEANLLSTAAGTLAFFVWFLRERGGFALDPTQIRSLVSYGGPLVVTALLALGMHQADRYLLRVFLDLEQVGLYSVAYSIGRGVNTLVLVPFSQIWYVAIYEVAREEDAKKVYTETFRYFVYGLILILFGLSLFAKPVLSVLVAKDFEASADLVPVVCLAYLFFSLHAHFNVPVLLAKSTVSLVPPHVAALLTNIGTNLVLIPAFGTWGAAWASVITFAVFAFVGLAVYRRIDRYDYPFARCGLALAGVLLSFVVWKIAFPWSRGSLLAGSVAAAIWILWCAVLLGPAMLALWRRRRAAARPEAAAIEAPTLSVEP
jgi:O-antigen/teichoic acid export membrane protein